MSNIQPIAYSNLHDYLDALFQGQRPSAEDIALAKKKYWLAYNARQQRERRKKNKYVRLFFTPQEYAQIIAGIPSKKNISIQLKKLLLVQNIKKSKSTKLDTTTIEQQLLTIIDQLEYLEEEGQIADGRKLRNILRTLENIERKIRL